MCFLLSGLGVSPPDCWEGPDPQGACPGRSCWSSLHRDPGGPRPAQDWSYKPQHAGETPHSHCCSHLHLARAKTQTPQLYSKLYVVSQFKNHITLLNKLRISRIFGKLPCLCLVDVFWQNGMGTILMLLFLSQILPSNSA